MPKIKTRKAAAKRFKVTKNGKVMHGHEGKRHILTKKSAKRKRQLRGSDVLSAAETHKVKRMLGLL